jgi:hypothetical protein
MREKLLLLWWRWHLQNNIIFGYGKARIVQSFLFLQSYLEYVKDTRDTKMIIDGKGKCPIDNQDANISQKRKEVIVPWSRPMQVSTNQKVSELGELFSETSMEQFYCRHGARFRTAQMQRLLRQ